MTLPVTLTWRRPRPYYGWYVVLVCNVVAFVTWGVGIFNLLHTVTLRAMVSRWFVRERTRAMAAATVGASFGGMALAPLNASVLDRWGGVGGALLAVLAVGAVVPMALLVVRSGPESMGLHPDGAPAPAASTSATGGDGFAWTVAQAMRTRAFWSILVSFHLVMIAQAGFLIHQVRFLRGTFGLVGAASVVTVTGLIGVVGRLGFVVIGGRLPARRLAAVVLLLQATGLLISALGQTHATLILGSAIFGPSIGVSISSQPVLAAECCGRQSFG